MSIDRIPDNKHTITMKAWAIGTDFGHGIKTPRQARKQEKKQKESITAFVSTVKNVDGFLGFYPRLPLGTIVIFRTENAAKIARNRLEAIGVNCGKEIAECDCEEIEPYIYACKEAAKG